MLFDVLFLALSLAFLFAGGEALVSGAVSLANRLRLPPSFIGLTIVGFGTSMPELMVSLEAALKGTPDIALGNVIGSNSANILLILGAAALIAPVTVGGRAVWRDLGAMVVVALALGGLALFGAIDRWAGLAMVVMLLGYLTFAAFSNRGQTPPAETGTVLPGWREAASLVLGLVLLMWGADLLIGSATSIAGALGVSEAVIGLTVVAVGTSLPELVTSVVAAIRRQAGIALGNVVGSNIFNIAGILGVTALVAPLPISAGFVRFDIPVMIAVSLALVLALAVFGRLSRLAGGAFLAAYALYLFMLV